MPNLLFADNGLRFVVASVVITGETIAGHPAKVKAFLKAEILGWQVAVADPKAGPAWRSTTTART